MNRFRVITVIQEDWGKSTLYGADSLTTQKKSITLAEPASNVYFEELPPYDLEDGQPEYVETLTDVDSHSLSYFHATLLASIVEDTITKLRILVSSNTEMRITKTMTDMPLLLALKYGVKQPAVKDELDGIDQRRLGCNEYKLNKLDADRKYFGTVLIDTYVGLSLTKTYHGLVNHINKIVDRDEFRAYLIQEEAKNRAARRDLTRQVRQQTNHFKSVIYDNDVIIDTLKTKVEDAALDADIRGRYVDNWQNARTEQHIQTISDKEGAPSDIIEYFKLRSEHEQRVHTEVELLINIAINETLEKVEGWMEKYDRDMEAIDLRIQIKKNDYQNMLDKRIGLEKTIANHDILMKDWVHFKDEREKARQYYEKMMKSAIVVQAWWRGLLVRLQLGPFKVKKKPKGKKK